MNNLLIGIKRFFKNKNTVTILAIVACLLILYFAYSTRIKVATEPQSVPYALRDLEPRTEITEDMVGIRYVPGSVITPNVITDMDSIVGMYVSDSYQIPEDSLFYKDTVLTWDALDKSPYADIKDGNTIFSLRVDLDKTYGNSIFKGNYIDLYYSRREGNDVYVGKFIESIKVTDVVDSNYISVFEKTESEAIPAYLLFEVPEDYYLLLTKTLKVCGDSCLIPVPRSAEYSLHPKETSISSSWLKDHILSQTVNILVEEEKASNNGGGN